MVLLASYIFLLLIIIPRVAVFELLVLMMDNVLGENVAHFQREGCIQSRKVISNT